MVKLSSINKITAGGKVVQTISANNQTLWTSQKKTLKYVSLGDSIASGHMIDDKWENGYQYGQGTNTETEILEGTYTDYIRKKLKEEYKDMDVQAISYCRSGSMVQHPDFKDKSLWDFLNPNKEQHKKLQQDLAEADLVTICIGANDILYPAAEKKDNKGDQDFQRIINYIIGDNDILTNTIEPEVERNLRVLDGSKDKEDISEGNTGVSFEDLLKRLQEINPKAKYVFTLVFNPMKYFYFDAGTRENEYKDGALGDLFEQLPQMSLLGKPELFDFDMAVKDTIINTLQPYISRINIFADWVERYMEVEEGQSSNGTYRGLNWIIKDSIDKFDSEHEHFFYSDIRGLFNSVTDRLGDGTLHYNDLINNQLTRGYKITEQEFAPLLKKELWGKEQDYTNLRSLLWDLFSEQFDPSKLETYNLTKVEEKITKIVNKIKGPLIDKVVHPLIDVHPRKAGHYIMYRAYADTIGLEPLKVITYNSNEGSSTELVTQKVLGRVKFGNENKDIYSTILYNPFGELDNDNNTDKDKKFSRWNTMIDGSGSDHEEGTRVCITEDTTYYAQWSEVFRYVSIGDSIAAGLRIQGEWDTSGEYLNSGSSNNYTKIVDNCYTDRMRKSLQEIYPDKYIYAKSYAVSGSHILAPPDANGEIPESTSLIRVLDHPSVINDIEKADLITVSIGANTILQSALFALPTFLLQGTGMKPLEREIESSIRNLADENYPYSYHKLIEKLLRLNPTAKIVFNTVYNPVKYFYLEKGTKENYYEDGFFGPWIKYLGDRDDYLSKASRGLILESDIISNLCTRINGGCMADDWAGSSEWEGISNWAERYIEKGGISIYDQKAYPSLNNAMRNAIDNYDYGENPRTVFYADVHELFDTIPNLDTESYLHFNDLVNMEITKGYDANNLPWKKLWGSSDETEDISEQMFNYWGALVLRYTSIDKVLDVVGLLKELVPLIITKVLSPAFDPHPRSYGHYVIFRAIMDALNTKANLEDTPTLLKIRLQNEQDGQDEKNEEILKVLPKDNGPYIDENDSLYIDKDIHSILTSHKLAFPKKHRLIGWVKDNKQYANCEIIPFEKEETYKSKLSNQCIVRYRTSKLTDWVGGDSIMPPDYQLWIDGIHFEKLGENSERVFSVPYGAPLGVVVSGITGGNFTSCDGYVSVNGEDKKLNDDRGYNLEGGVTSDLIIDFQWRTTGVEADILLGAPDDRPLRSFYTCHIDSFDASQEELEHLCTIKFDLNNNEEGFSGVMEEQKLLRYNDTALETLVKSKFDNKTGWYVAEWIDSFDSDLRYKEGGLCLIQSDTTLHAHWSDLHKLTIIQKNNTNVTDLPFDCRDIKRGNSSLDLDRTWSTGDYQVKEQTFYIPYGENITISVGGKAVNGHDKQPDCRIFYKFNGGAERQEENYGQAITKESGTAIASFTMPAKPVKVRLHFEKAMILGFDVQYYWNALIVDKDIIPKVGQ